MQIRLEQYYNFNNIRDWHDQARQTQERYAGLTAGGHNLLLAQLKPNKTAPAHGAAGAGGDQHLI